MATFRAFAKVLEPSEPAMRLHEAGWRDLPSEGGLVQRPSERGGVPVLDRAVDAGELGIMLGGAS